MPPLTAKKMSKIGTKREKSGKREEKLGKIEKRRKIGKKGQNREGSFTLPLLTNRAGYATGRAVPASSTQNTPPWYSNCYKFCVCNLHFTEKKFSQLLLANIMTFLFFECTKLTGHTFRQHTVLLCTRITLVIGLGIYLPTVRNDWERASSR